MATDVTGPLAQQVRGGVRPMAERRRLRGTRDTK
jgi:hypothetical protein